MCQRRSGDALLARLRARPAGNGESRCSTGSATVTSIRPGLLSDEEAAETLLANLDGEAMADPRPVRFAPGRRLKAWDKNVVALGLSSGSSSRSKSTSIHLIQTGIHRLLAMFPATGFNQADIDEYNRQSRFEYEDVRDFIIAHYKVTRRSGDPFWDHVREMDVPDSLTERLELFRSSGRFFKRGAQELFAEESWVQVLLGQGLEMTPDPVTRFVRRRGLLGFLSDLADVIDDVSDKMPDHGSFVAKLPPSSAPQPAAQPSSVSFALKYERITTDRRTTRGARATANEAFRERQIDMRGGKVFHRLWREVGCVKM